MKALVPIADGTEEMEAVVVIDAMRRAGWQVVVASICGPTVTCSRGVVIEADVLWESVKPGDFDLLYLPGGTAGTKALASHSGVLSAARAFARNNRTVAAICAAPLVLQAAGLISGKRITCHPGVRGQITGSQVLDRPVVTDGHIVTSRGAGTALELALELVEMHAGKEARRHVAEGMAADA